MAENEEKGYEIIDKRKVRLDENGEAQTQPEAETQSEEQKATDAGPSLPPVDVYSLLKSFIGILGSQAWQWMGLIKDPVTGNIEKDLAQAKVAIDTIAAMAHQLEGKIDPSEQRELKAMVSDLQINFVQQSGK